MIIAPPPPVVIILFPLKLKQPTSPNVPKCFFYKTSKATAASSISLRLYFFAIVLILSIFDE